jgi:Tfp pilus assembly protein PilF
VKKGDNDRAITDANEAIRLDPKIVGAYVNRAGAYLQKGDNDRAIANASEAIRLDPKIAIAYNNRAAAYAKKGESDRSIADATEAIQLDPGYAVAYRNRAGAYLEKGSNDRAIADASEAIRLDPKVAVAYAYRAEAYMQEGENTHAITDYSEAIRLDPKMSQSYFRRGLLNLYEGAVDKALADLTQAGELAPKDAYLAVWLDIVRRRNNLPSRLVQSSAQLDLTAWPAPVIKLFMGQLTPGDLLAAADDPNAPTKKDHICEAIANEGSDRRSHPPIPACFERLPTWLHRMACCKCRTQGAWRFTLNGFQTVTTASGHVPKFSLGANLVGTTSDSRHRSQPRGFLSRATCPPDHAKSGLYLNADTERPFQLNGTQSARCASATNDIHGSSQREQKLILRTSIISP